jgi:hypothetical protein
MELMRWVFAFCFFYFTCQFAVVSQTGPDYSSPDAVARAAPDSVEKSMTLLSDYFKLNLKTSRDLIRAFYYWTAHEISYDVDNMFNLRPVDNSGKMILEILETRKAVCQGYAEIFHELCKNAGIECYRIQGYTKQNGTVMSLSHMWILARLDTTWCFFDPTWGSGYLLNGKFNRKFLNDFFMVRPSVMIRSHMPFDPMWQCLNYPLNSSDFYNGVAPKADPQRYFAFADSIAAYEKLSKNDQFAAALRRIEDIGVVNNNIGEYVRILRINLESEKINRENELRGLEINKFNEAVNHYNSASLLFNEYINYWNRQFKPTKPDGEIRQMLDTCKTHLTLCRNILATIRPTEDMMQNMGMFTQTVKDIEKKVDEQGFFLKEYLGTAKASRPKLFTKSPF